MHDRLVLARPVVRTHPQEQEAQHASSGKRQTDHQISLRLPKRLLLQNQRDQHPGQDGRR